MTEIEQVTDDTGSIFHALGLPDADDLLLRAERLLAIGKIITERGLKQHAVGTLLGMKRLEISALVRGNINMFSSESLARIMHDLRDAAVGC